MDWKSRIDKIVHESPPEHRCEMLAEIAKALDSVVVHNEGDSRGLRRLLSWLYREIGFLSTAYRQRFQARSRAVKLLLDRVLSECPQEPQAKLDRADPLDLLGLARALGDSIADDMVGKRGSQVRKDLIADAVKCHQRLFATASRSLATGDRGMAAALATRRAALLRALSRISITPEYSRKNLHHAFGSAYWAHKQNSLAPDAMIECGLALGAQALLHGKHRENELEKAENWLLRAEATGTWQATAALVRFYRHSGQPAKGLAAYWRLQQSRYLDEDLWRNAFLSGELLFKLWCNDKRAAKVQAAKVEGCLIEAIQAGNRDARTVISLALATAINREHAEALGQLKYLEIDQPDIEGIVSTERVIEALLNATNNVDGDLSNLRDAFAFGMDSKYQWGTLGTLFFEFVPDAATNGIAAKIYKMADLLSHHKDPLAKLNLARAYDRIGKHADAELLLHSAREMSHGAAHGFILDYMAGRDLS